MNVYTFVNIDCLWGVFEVRLKSGPYNINWVGILPFYVELHKRHQ